MALPMLNRDEQIRASQWLAKKHSNGLQRHTTQHQIHSGKTDRRRTQNTTAITWRALYQFGKNQENNNNRKNETLRNDKK